MGCGSSLHSKSLRNLRSTDHSPHESEQLAKMILLQGRMRINRENGSNCRRCDPTAINVAALFGGPGGYKGSFAWYLKRHYGFSIISMERQLVLSARKILYDNSEGASNAGVLTKNVIKELSETRKSSLLAYTLRQLTTEVRRLGPGSRVAIDILPNHLDLISSPLLKNSAAQIAAMFSELDCGLAIQLVSSNDTSVKEETHKHRLSQPDEADPLQRARRSLLVNTLAEPLIEHFITNCQLIKVTTTSDAVPTLQARQSTFARILDPLGYNAAGTTPQRPTTAHHTPCIFR